MKGEFKAGCSPLTSRIFVGTVLKNGIWGKDKKDVTETVVGAVAQHLIQLDQSVTFNMDGKKYILRVDEIKPTE